jgi:hypothetical protein
MKSKCAAVLVVIMVLALGFAMGMQLSDAGTMKPQPGKAVTPTTMLPPLPVDVTEVKFGEFFATPVGPRGLTLTSKLLGLNGKRVRMIGYMVRQETALPGTFLFTAMPVQLHDHDSSDDLPPAVVHVLVPTCRDRQVPYVPGLMLLTGTLHVGPREEADGRISLARLALDPPQPAARLPRGAAPM